MQLQEISLTELITYFDDTVSGPSKTRITERIEQRKHTNPRFAAEMEEWESFIEDNPEQDKGAALAQLRQFLEVWHTTEVQPVEEDEDEAQIAKGEDEVLVRPLFGRKESRVSPDTTNQPNNRAAFTPEKEIEPPKQTIFRWYTYATAATIALLASLWFFWPEGQSADLYSAVEAEYSSEIMYLAGAQMGAKEDLDEAIRENHKSDRDAASLPLLEEYLSTQPEDKIKYQLLKGVILANTGQTTEAIQVLQSLYDSGQLSNDNSCRAAWYLALMYHQSQQSKLFHTLTGQWNDTKASKSCRSWLNPHQIELLDNMAASMPAAQ